jgi:hypothetical protein
MAVRGLWCWGGEACSFLKKRTKKLLRMGRARFNRRALVDKSFLLLFFKKEESAFPFENPTHQACLTQSGER